MKTLTISLISIFTFFTSIAQNNCEKSRAHGQGYTTFIEGAYDNCDGSSTVVLRVEHDGCSGPSCKDLSNYSIEASQGTYSNVSVNVISGSMSYGSIDLGPNLGSKIPFDGFKIDGISGFGNGKAGAFNVTYTLSGNFQSQRVSAKPGNNILIENFSNLAFDSVKTCQGNNCISTCGTGPALDFNIFIDEDLKLITNETEGPVAVCRDLWVAGSYQISTHSVGSFNVGNVPISAVVGNKVKYKSGNELKINQNGYIKIGNCSGSNVWYTDQNGASSPVRITPNNWYNASPRIQLQANANQLGVSANNNPVCQSNVLDFAQAFLDLRQNSINLSKLANNAQLTNANGNSISNNNLPNQVKINLQTGINVLNVNGTDLNNVSVFTYNQKPDSSRYLVINVDAAGTFDWDVWNQAGIGFNESKYIMYNFYNSSTLNIKGSSSILGTIMAPSTHIKKSVNQGNIEGQVIGKSFNHSGGEVHYAIFEPKLEGCGTMPYPTTSMFQPNSTDACLEGNQIIFTNSSLGQAPLTHIWDFGDGNFSNQVSPVHSYANPGIYNVKLAVSGPGGNDTSSINITINPLPNSNFSINDTIQDSTSNNFIFTPIQLSNIKNLNWSFGDGTTSHLLFPQKKYSSLGAYNVVLTLTDNSGCFSSSQVLVSVVADSSSSGNDGGIESKSLEGKLSQLKFERRMNNHIPFSISNAEKFSKVNSSKRSSTRLEKYLPTNLSGNLVGYKSSPNHLLSITNAEEVVSIDYAEGNKTKAVVLATVTSLEPYNHTKYTCDRFLKGKVTYLEPIEINGLNYILFAIDKYNGMVEYGIEFSASYNVNDQNFDMQTSWLINEYAKTDSMYNFQIWANSPNTALKLAEEITTRLNADKPLIANQIFNYPAVYVTSGYREEGKLKLTLKNTTTDPYLITTWAEKENEQVPFDTLLGELVTYEDSVGTFDFEVGDKYEFDIYFYLNGKLEDKIYMADANWGLDYVSNYTSVSNFSISNNQNQVDYSEKLPLYRDVDLTANTADYITLFKDISGGGLPTNLNDYIGLSFWASGKGKVKIRLFSESINHWRAQYYTFVELSESGELFQLAFEDFESDSSSTSIKLDDIVTASLTYVSESFDYEDFEISLNDAAFVKEFQVVSVKDNTVENEKALLISPNPGNGKFNLTFNSLNKFENGIIIIRDIAGREVIRQGLNVLEGQNQIQFDFSKSLKSGNYIFTLQNGDNKLQTTPLIVK